MTHDRAALDALLTEKRRFAPPAEFAAAAVVSDPSVYDRAEDFEAFWAGWAEELDWFEEWDTVLEWNPPHARWFGGGKAERLPQLCRPAPGRAAAGQDGAALGR